MIRDDYLTITEDEMDKVIDPFEEKIRENFKFASYAPIIYISAKTGRNFDKIKG